MKINWVGTGERDYLTVNKEKKDNKKGSDKDNTGNDFLQPILGNRPP